VFGSYLQRDCLVQGMTVTMRVRFLCLESDLNKYEFKYCFQKIIEDLETSEIEGITIQGFATKVKGTIMAVIVSRDGIHTLRRVSLNVQDECSFSKRNYLISFYKRIKIKKLLSSTGWTCDDLLKRIA
jgi:hypothetical protein